MELLKTAKVTKATIALPVTEYRSLPIPGVADARLGVAYVRVTDIPRAFDDFMEINPRVPSRTGKGVLAGPVVKGILQTLREAPEQMVLKNQGIYILTDSLSYDKAKNGQPTLLFNFTDPGKHGIINGGHTYAAIREAIETAGPEELDMLQEAYVRVHIFQGIDEDYVPEIAEGLNRSKQVDDPSLSNLQGEFDIIRKVLRGTPGEKAVAYHQGDSGDVYISEILVYLEMFNKERFNERKHPNNLYNRQALGLKYFAEDMATSTKNMQQLINMLPDFLKLSDTIRKHTPGAAKQNNFKFGAVKLGGAERAGGHKAIPLPFIASTTTHRVPNGWVFPIMAAFRANIVYGVVNNKSTIGWKVPLAEIVPAVIDDLVGVCVAEHRDNNMRPELIGKRESAYSQCYTKLQLYLAKRGLLY